MPKNLSLSLSLKPESFFCIAFIPSTKLTSIIFSVKHEPGALYQILKEFNDNDINLTKIESRPNKNTNWEYNFFVDFLGHFSNDKIQSVLKNISENVLFLKIIGSYPIADLD